MSAIRVGDTGRPFVMLPPMLTDSSCWLYQQAHFSSWYRTLAIDLPGTRRSPALAEGSDLRAFATACWELVDRTFGADHPIVAGVSIGSTVAQYMAAER